MIAIVNQQEIAISWEISSMIQCKIPWNLMGSNSWKFNWLSGQIFQNCHTLNDHIKLSHVVHKGKTAATDTILSKGQLSMCSSCSLLFVVYFIVPERWVFRSYILKIFLSSLDRAWEIQRYIQGGHSLGKTHPKSTLIMCSDLEAIYCLGHKTNLSRENTTGPTFSLLPLEDNFQ